VSTWTTDELDGIGAAEEIEIAVRRPDGTLRRPVPIWVVRSGDELYIRSWRGTAGGWFRAAQTSHAAHIRAGGIETDVQLVNSDADVDAEYRAKYGRYPTYVEPMVAPQARATTLKIVRAQ
jgi:hypothetical protein